MRLPDGKTLAHAYALEPVKGFGPQTFCELRDRALTASGVFASPSRLPTGGKRGGKFRAEIASLASAYLEVFEQRAARKIERAAQDPEKLRKAAPHKEFEVYRQVVGGKKHKVFRLEAMRAGFGKAWREKDYRTIVEVAKKIPEFVLQEDPKLLIYYDNALGRTGDS